MKKQEEKLTNTEPRIDPSRPRRAFVAPVLKPAGALNIHFCSGINLWDSTGGTLQCQ